MTRVAPAVISLATEGNDDLVVAKRLVEHVGHVVGPGPGAHGGAPNLDPRLPAYCRAAAHQPWFVLRDLDKATCAPSLVAELAPHRPATMLLRIAVRAIEAWFFADRESLAEYLKVTASKVPREPDSDPWPKRTMADLARSSRSRAIKGDMVPPDGAKRYYGAAYTARMIEYAEKVWRPEVARRASPSLDSALRALESLGGGA